MSGLFDVPVLFIVFNRPDLTSTVLRRLREVRPARLFVAADGPRAKVAGEAERVAEVRNVIAREVDWPCRVEHLYREQNLGCLEAVASAISWFFEHVDAGIILEDDCLPDDTFFPYCREMLRRYADHAEVLHIGGTNPLPPYAKPTSYYFSKYNRIWGWATWRRAWRHFDAALSFWPEVKAQGGHLPWFPDPVERAHWERRWDDIHAGNRDTWDHQWFLCRLLHGRAIIPMTNLVSNLGFRADATHTLDPNSDLSCRPCQPLAEPFVHPADVAIDEELDRAFFDGYVRDRILGQLQRERARAAAGAGAHQ